MTSRTVQLNYWAWMNDFKENDICDYLSTPNSQLTHFITRGRRLPKNAARRMADWIFCILNVSGTYSLSR